MAQSQSRTRVPVSTRTKKTGSKAPRPVVKQLGVPGLALLGVIILVILFAVYVPMQNYFEGRAEIDRLEREIAAHEQTKNDLTNEIKKYSDDAFVKEEARRRLGVVEEGETAWRIIDPRMTPEGQVTTSKVDEKVIPQWYEVLWDSIALDPSVQ